MTSPARIEGSARVREAMTTEAVEARARMGEGDTSLALRGGRTAPTGVVGPSDTAAPTDARRFGRMASAMSVVLDPMFMLGMARAAMKDAQVSQQESAIDTQSDRAAQAAEDRQVALEKAVKAAEEAKGWGLFAQIATRVAAVVVAAVGFVTGAFTGGAGVALGVGLLIVAFGSDLQLMMKDANVDKDVTAAVGLGAAIVGTCCTLGAGCASLLGVGASAAATVAQTTAQAVASFVDAGANILAGTANGVSAGYRWDSAHRRIDGEVATEAAHEATDLIDQHVAETREFLASYQRVVQRLQRISDAQNEAMSAAAQTRA